MLGTPTAPNPMSTRRDCSRHHDATVIPHPGGRAPRQHARLVALLVAPLLAVALIGAAPPTTVEAAPLTVKASAYAHLKTFLNQDNAFGFSGPTRIGSLLTFRRTLTSVKVKVDRSLKPMARYDPKTHTISFSKDPRRLRPAQVMDFGETVWHELVHAIEDDRGDIGVLDSANYAERNVEYMAQVVNVAFPRLRQLERLARKGASVDTLAKYWEFFLKSMDAAAQDAITNGYPVKPATLSTWFGFTANVTKIKKYYLSGTFLPGRAGANLRAALSRNTSTAPSWSGTWSTDWGPMTLTQSGSSVTGTYTHDSGRITGTVNGLTLTGRWSEQPTYAGPSDAGTFIWTMTTDGTSFSGTWAYDGGGGGRWVGTRQ